MLKRTLIITALLIIGAFNAHVNAQGRPSLEETKTWILQKLNNYLVHTVAHHFYPFSVFLKSSSEGVTQSEISITDDGFLFIKVTLLHYQFSGDESVRNESGTISYKIPIYDVDVEKFDGRHIQTKNNLQSIIEATDLYNPDYSEGTIHDSNYYSKIELRIDYEREDNLLERMKKALIVLQYYCPKPKSNEAF